MSDPLAHYSFIPWMRRGLGNKISEEDQLGNTVSGDSFADERAEIDVDLVLKYQQLSGGTGESAISKIINVVSPGDINGINPKAILRTEPAQNVNNFEPNLLAFIEFYEEDFPWRYSPIIAPSSPTDRTKLRPWLSLIVLEESEFELRNNGAELPTISIAEEALGHVFVNQTETWAWAHVHLNQSLDNANLIGGVDTLLQTDPDIGISRIICPRKLNKSKNYTGFLIPTFEVGRLAGLGQNTSSIKAQAPAWTKSGDTVSIAEVPSFNSNTFPFYFQWSFRTGELGDFETLVSILKPFPTDPESGKMPMDIQSPGYNLDGMADTKVLGFEGALKPPGFTPDNFPSANGDKAFEEELRKLLNLAVDATEDGNTSILNSSTNPFYSAPFVEDPMIVPPIYGYWHAMIKKLGHSGNPRWIEKLNLDPRHRGAAGLGTQTIIKHQERFMQQAWEQIGEVNEANQKIREAEMAKMVNKAIYSKHLKRSEDDQFTQVTSKMHTRMKSSSGSKTVHKDFKSSRIPNAVRSYAFRKFTRPEKKSNRRLNLNTAATDKVHRKVISRFNTGASEVEDPQITAAKIKRPGPNAVNVSAVSGAIENAKNSYLQQDTYLAKDLLFLSIKGANLTTLDKNQIKNQIDLSTGAYQDIRDNDPVRWGNIKSIVEQSIDSIEAYDNSGGNLEVKLNAANHKTLFASAEADAVAPANGKTYQNIRVFRDPDLDEAERNSKATTLEDIVSFQTSFDELSNMSTQANFVRPGLRPVLLDIEDTYGHIREELRPEKTIPKKVLRGLKVWRNGAYEALEEMKVIMAYPKFKEAVYELLLKLSQDFILPNVEQLPRNSLTILTTNQSFIESFMAGMNHEMARELLWREYPTDQRGSYFRQFWDIKDDVFQTDEELKKDIQEMHKWTGYLGEHRSNPAQGNLVLVVRGDLLLKYPNTMIYAQKASYDSDDPSKARTLPSQIDQNNALFPIFTAELEPDIFLFGFQLTTEEAKGERAHSPSTNTNNMNPGWFFVFRERPGQIKFGLDDYADQDGDTDIMPDSNPDTWNDLSWEHLVASKDELNHYVIDLNTSIAISSPPADRPTPNWAANSADMASILYQNPVIFARHADEML